MCGFAGIYHKNGASVDIEILGKMTSILKHRGPDDGNVWIGGNVGLGHRRLSIRDLSSAGRQPFWDSTGRVVVVFNGEIYNYPSLRKKLEGLGAEFKTKCDTELIPVGYLLLGPEIFNVVEGIFSIALWDCTKKHLYLARDAMGVKPLYYSDTASTLRFGSELKALLVDPDQSRDLSHESLHTFLALGYAGPEKSLLKNINQVPPGTVIKFSAQGRVQKKFWQPTRKACYRDLEEAREAFEPLFESVISEQMASDVPLGVLQSGGIDSTLISSSYSCLGGRTLYTARFNDSSYDESSLATLVAEKLQADHKWIVVDEPVDQSELFRKIVYHNDGQLADSSSLAFYRLSEKVSKHSKVVLSGDGADELFAGYDTYLATLFACYAAPPVPGWVRNGGQKVLSVFSPDRGKRLSSQEIFTRLCDGLAIRPRINAHAAWRRLLPAGEISGLYGESMRELVQVNPLSGYEAALDEHQGSVLDRCLLADQAYYLPSDMLMKVDAMSMAHGLEVRVPFLDRRIVDFASSLSARLLISPTGKGKRVLRSILASRDLPSEIYQGKKMGFQIPLARMLRTSLKELGRGFENTWPMLLEPLFNPDRVRSLWQEHLSGQRNHAYALWALMTLAVWTETSDISIR